MGKKKWLVVVGTLVVLAVAIGIYASVNKVKNSVSEPDYSSIGSGYQLDDSQNYWRGLVSGILQQLKMVIIFLHRICFIFIILIMLLRKLLLHVQSQNVSTRIIHVMHICGVLLYSG